MCPSRTALPMDYRLRPQVAQLHTHCSNADIRDHSRTRAESAQPESVLPAPRIGWLVGWIDLGPGFGDSQRKGFACFSAVRPKARNPTATGRAMAPTCRLSSDLPRDGHRRILKHPSMIWGSWCSLAKSEESSYPHLAHTVSHMLGSTLAVLLQQAVLMSLYGTPPTLWASGVRCHAPARNSYHPWLAGVTDRTTAVRRGRPCRLNVKLA